MHSIRTVDIPPIPKTSGSVWRHPEYYRLTFVLILHFLRVFGTDEEFKLTSVLFELVDKKWTSGPAEDVYISLPKLKRPLAGSVLSVVQTAHAVEKMGFIQIRTGQTRVIEREGGKKIRLVSESFGVHPEAPWIVRERFGSTLAQLHARRELLLGRDVYYMCPQHADVGKTVDFMQANRQGMKCRACQLNLLEVEPSLVGRFYQCPKHIPEDKTLYSTYMRAAAPYLDVWRQHMKCIHCGGIVKEVNGLFWASNMETTSMKPLLHPDAYETPQQPCEDEESEPAEIDEHDFVDATLEATAFDEYFVPIRRVEEDIRLHKLHWTKSFLPILRSIDRQPLLTTPKHLPLHRIEYLESFKPFAYQREGLDAFRETDGHISSGVAVMPCGSGKTILGMMLLREVIQSFSTGDRMMIVCNSHQAIQQWMETLFRFTTLVYERKRVAIFHSRSSYPSVAKAQVVLVSYHLWTRTRLGASNQAIRDMLNRSHIRCVMLDEVHLVTAPIFRMAVKECTPVKIGLTATFKDDDQQRIITQHVGKIRYHVSVSLLVRLGHIAEVEYRFVKCRPLFADTWLPKTGVPAKNRPYVSGLNPGLLVTALNMISEYVRKRPDVKIMVMSDYKAPIKMFRLLMGASKCLYVDGEVPREVRVDIYHQFQTDAKANVLLISRVGEIALDIPNTNVLIQLSWMHGNNVQAVQRGGRLARRKRSDANCGENYILVSDEPNVVEFAEKAAEYVRKNGFRTSWFTSDVCDVSVCERRFGSGLWRSLKEQVQSYT